MRSSAFSLAVLLAVFFFEDAQAQVRKFPYKAVVVVDEVYVRSGGGENFYATQRLIRDAVVTVRRHDPGGWYVIEPPDGSFSWVPAKYVERGADDSGVITENDIVAFVGSEFGDESNVWQRKLVRGEQVRVLGERELDTLAGRRRMYRIAPPVREWRWIPGAALVPHNPGLRQQHDLDPWQMPSTIRRESAPLFSDPASPGPSPRLARLKAIRSEQRQLAEIDQRFREMICRTPSEWDLASLEAEYSALQQSATHRPVAGQIDLRYPAIDRYRKRRAAWDELDRLTSETERRDADLVASRYGSGGISEEPPIGQESPNLQELPAAQGPLPGFSPFSPFTDSTILNAPASSRGITPDGHYIGAGIVGRSASGEFILTSPAGRVLARLEETKNVDLDEFLGRQVGLYGKRWYRDDLRSDYIEVSGLEAVRIRLESDSPVSGNGRAGPFQ